MLACADGLPSTATFANAVTVPPMAVFIVIAGVHNNLTRLQTDVAEALDFSEDRGFDCADEANIVIFRRCWSKFFPSVSDLLVG